ncbi:MAG: hypothetical protein AB1427_08755, partial [Thermodesulfobacteriota bacterium]
CSFHELGFKDKRKGDSPNRLWGSLLLLAKCGGRIDGKFLSTLEQDDARKFIDNTRALNKVFQQLFGIDESIYQGNYRSYKAYITKFKIEDKRILREPIEPEQSMYDSEIESFQQRLSAKRKLIKPAE